MNICDTVDLGQFDYCDGVVISDPVIVGDVSVESLTTAFTCTYSDGDFGSLGVGFYIFSYDDINYIFEVI
jgi:hypothetical protein